MKSFQEDEHNDPNSSFRRHSARNGTSFQSLKSGLRPPAWNRASKKQVSFVRHSLADALSKFVEGDSSSSDGESMSVSEDDQSCGPTDLQQLMSESSELKTEPYQMSTDGPQRNSRVIVSWQEDKKKAWKENVEEYKIKCHFRSKSAIVGIPNFNSVSKEHGEESLLLHPLIKKGGRPRSKSLQDGYFEANPHHDIRLHETEKDRLIRISAAFLMDYEASRPATLHHDAASVSFLHLFMHDIRFSRGWTFVLFFAATCLCGVSYIDIAPEALNEGYELRMGVLLALLTFLPTAVFYLDMAIMSYLRTPSSPSITRYSLYQREITTPRASRSQLWSLPLALSLFLLCVERAIHLSLGRRGIMWSAMLMPVAFFYIFQEARDALEALRRIAPQTMRILLAELSLIVVFAAVACILYGSQYSGSFGNLQLSFISLFECKYCC